jgi:hypothetical protein
MPPAAGVLACLQRRNGICQPISKSLEGTKEIEIIYDICNFVGG